MVLRNKKQNVPVAAAAATAAVAPRADTIFERFRLRI